MVAIKTLCAAALIVCLAVNVDAFGGGRRGGNKRGSGSGSGKGSGHKRGGKRGGLRAGGFLNRGNNTNTTVPIANTKYTVPKGWVVRKALYCSVANRVVKTRFTTFKTALAACNKNSTCTAVMDTACRGKAFFACSKVSRGYANCAAVKSSKTRKPTKSTTVCQTKVISKICSHANINMDLTSAQGQKVMCATPCAKYLNANMNSCAITLSKLARKTPETELFLANVDKYCHSTRKHGGKRSGGKRSGGKRSGGKRSGGKRSGKGGKGSGKSRGI